MLDLCMLHLLAKAISESMAWGDGQQRCAATTKERSCYHLITTGGYVQAQNAPTSDGALRPPKGHIRGVSRTSMSTVTWTATFCGHNLASHNSSTVSVIR